MKLAIELENLEKNVQDVLEQNATDVIKNCVFEMIRNEVNEVVKETISLEVNNNITSYVREYLTTTTIKVGGGFYDKKEEETFTVDQFIKKEIADCMQSKTLTTRKRDRYGDCKTNTVSFEEFIKNEFDIEEDVRCMLSSFMKEVRNDVNKKIENQFNEATKQTLSDNILTLLSKNDTFVKIQDNIKSIANRKD